jgi:glycine hydroxymethyltransferase
MLAGVNVIVSRTGYTGEEIGFECYLHPKDAPMLWNAILEKGEDLGVKPVALGARDTTRTEAGFPLYGQELAGPHDITPKEAGYGAFVKFHKPFFIGRKPYIEKVKERDMEIVRFKMAAKGVKMVKPNDPVVSAKGEHIGYVTSSVVVEGFQVGLAYVNQKYTEVGTKIGIFSLPRKGKPPEEKPKDEMGIGDKTMLHEEAEIIDRFLLTEEPRTVKPIK